MEAREAPRRCYVDLMVPAEKAILDAMYAVEAMAADVRLTDAVILLGQAKDKVSDFVDSAAPAVPAQGEDDEHRRVLRALGNCYMMAKREIARILNGKANCDAQSLERWQHVQRFCEEAGCTSSILRAQVPTELTEGER